MSASPSQLRGLCSLLLRPKGKAVAFPRPCTTRVMASSTSVELTKNRYPDIQRGDYGTINDKHLKFFTDILGKDSVLTNPSDCEGYNVDWIKTVRGYSQCVLKPKTTEDVSKILAFCNENRLAVCPQGGNTGLVGGSVPVFDEVVLSTSHMNKILSTDPTSGVLVCEAGCILEALEAHVEQHDLMIPLDLGAKGSCQIGGNVSTNAGGLRLVRYGNLHGSVLGVEAVKANGEIIDCLSTLKKDNTGYHLKHLFIGSEGTLGVVTKVAIHCPPKPKAVNLAFLGLSSFEDVLKTVRKAKQDLAEILSSCELIDSTTMGIVTGFLKVQCPIEDNHPFYMLIETQGSNNLHDEEKLNSFLQAVMESGLVLDGTTTNELTKMKKMWTIRESITEALMSLGYVFKYDISLPPQNFYALVPAMQERLGNNVTKVTGYGHLGDGNIHLNIVAPEFSQELYKQIEPYVYEYTSKLRGSISAEHGIGLKKPKYIHYSKSTAAINMMKQMKRLMDPNGILNPYKMLPK